MEGNLKRVTAFVNQESVGRARLNTHVDEYVQFYDQKENAVERRKADYTTLVNHFYDVVTNFYEFGWGQSFHFAPRRHWESFEASIFRHEMYLAHRLGLQRGQKVLDVGCGVGGPARTIAVFSEANVVGLNNNDYQIERAKKLTAEARLSHQLSFMKADFMHIPVEADHFDAIYAIEATCHAPDKVGCYAEIYRVLKPGQLFGVYEWVITDKFDFDNPEHVQIKEDIEKGNGLPDLVRPKEVVDALKEAGFELVEARDLAEAADERTPWQSSLSGSLSLTGFTHTRIGRTVTHCFVWTLEKLRIAPAGTTAVSGVLTMTADAIVKGGDLGIFSPMFFCLAKKPE
ncbi:Methyltransferase [Balamuthia mandrillaris]